MLILNSKQRVIFENFPLLKTLSDCFEFRADEMKKSTFKFEFKRIVKKKLKIVMHIQAHIITPKDALTVNDNR